jgi:hypothetical protein
MYILPPCPNDSSTSNTRCNEGVRTTLQLVILDVMRVSQNKCKKRRNFTNRIEREQRKNEKTFLMTSHREGWALLTRNIC